MRTGSFLAAAAFFSSSVLAIQSAHGGTTSITVRPAEQTTNPSYGASGTIATGDPTTGAPGFGSSSFISGGTNTEFDIVPSNVPSLGALTIADLKSITYNTKNNSATNEDWDIRIYTVNDGSDPNNHNFYLNRFESPNPNAGNANWHSWSTDNSVAVFNVHSGTGANTPVNTTAHGLNDLDGTYGSEKIFYIAFIAGYSAQPTPITDNLDGITFTLNNGNAVAFDLVPEPASASMLILGAGGLLMRRRRASR